MLHERGVTDTVSGSLFRDPWHQKRFTMPTINQLIKKPRRSLKRINKVKDLEASPAKRGVCLVGQDDEAQEDQLGIA